MDWKGGGESGKKWEEKKRKKKNWVLVPLSKKIAKRVRPIVKSDDDWGAFKKNKKLIIKKLIKKKINRNKLKIKEIATKHRWFFFFNQENDILPSIFG